jgi:hypothetical protein
MKKTLSLLVAALFLVAFNPVALAQGEGEETAPAEETTTEEGEAEEGEAEDPWSVPETTEGTEEDQAAEEAEPETVTPSGYPTAEIDRPLALPKMTLEPFANFHLVHWSVGEFDFNGVSLQLGTGFGITDNLEAGLMFPLVLSPDFDAGDVPIYGLYEVGSFMDDKLRVAGRLTMNLPLQTDFKVVADAPVKFKFHDMFAAIGGVGIGLGFYNDTAFLINFDMGMLVQPMEALALEARLGIHVGVADASATLVPLYFRGQYTLMGDLDAYAEFGFYDLNHAGADIFVFFVGVAHRLGV